MLILCSPNRDVDVEVLSNDGDEDDNGEDDVGDSSDIDEPDPDGVAIRELMLKLRSKNISTKVQKRVLQHLQNHKNDVAFFDNAAPTDYIDKKTIKGYIKNEKKRVKEKMYKKFKEQGWNISDHLKLFVKDVPVDILEKTKKTDWHTEKTMTQFLDM